MTSQLRPQHETPHSKPITAHFLNANQQQQVNPDKRNPLQFHHHYVSGSGTAEISGSSPQHVQNKRGLCPNRGNAVFS